MKSEQVHSELVGKKYSEIIERIMIDENSGACCGFAYVDAEGALPPHINKDDLTLQGCALLDYSDERDEDRKTLNFVFVTPVGEQFVLGYTLSAGSSSGYSYGAFASVSLDGKELASVSW